MSDSAKNTRANIIPTLRYKDAPAALDWLCEAFGFEKNLVVPDESGGIAHAQLVFGNGMVMLGSARDDAFGTLQAPLDAGHRAPMRGYHRSILSKSEPSMPSSRTGFTPVKFVVRAPRERVVE